MKLVVTLQVPRGNGLKFVFYPFSDYAEPCMYDLFLFCTIIIVGYALRPPFSARVLGSVSLYTSEA